MFIKRIFSRKIKHFAKIVEIICNINNNYTCIVYNPSTNFSVMIKMFTEADFIFGPHGAGFTNIIVSKKEVKILELIRENLPVLCFATLSYTLGYRYTRR